MQSALRGLTIVGYKMGKGNMVHCVHLPGEQETLSKALQQLQSALDLLDRTSAPAAIGAKIDLAVHELYTVIVSVAAGSRFDQIDRNAAPQ